MGLEPNGTIAFTAGSARPAFIVMPKKYPVLALDSEGQKLDGANEYSLRFPAGEVPPVNAFWSITMYELPASLLVDNPINRYLLNSAMMDEFIKDADGGITPYFQNECPGSEKEAKWLPAPNGAFWVNMRLYWPKESALGPQQSGYGGG